METLGLIGSGNIGSTVAKLAILASCDIVVVTVPLKNLRDIYPELLNGRIVVDTMNYYPERDGHIGALDSGSISTSELVQKHFAGSRVVKGFNNISYSHLAGLPTSHRAPRRSALPIATDSGARRAVTQLINRLGYDVVDAGPIAEGWRFERGRPPIAPCVADPQALSLSTPANRPTETRVADAREIRELLEKSNR
ncbi:NADPH-dependent F420 reductase [Arthrobacter sp. TMN-49]